tara:strand:- start:282 stop:731 length:450 start_codon:yes stop_codon:yes gene_type:complete
MAFKMKGDPIKRNFGIGGPMKKKKGSATSAETKTGYSDRVAKEGADRIKKDLTESYSRKQLSKGAIDYLGREHTKGMKDMDKYAKPSRNMFGESREFYRDEIQRGKMPTKNVTKVNRSKSDVDAKSLKGSKKPNVKQQRELNPRKRKRK